MVKRRGRNKRGRPRGSRKRRPNLRLFLDVLAIQDRYNISYQAALKFIRQPGFPPRVDGHYWWYRRNVAAFDRGERFAAQWIGGTTDR